MPELDSPQQPDDTVGDLEDLEAPWAALWGAARTIVVRQPANGGGDVVLYVYPTTDATDTAWRNVVAAATAVPDQGDFVATVGDAGCWWPHGISHDGEPYGMPLTATPFPTAEACCAWVKAWMLGEQKKGRIWWVREREYHLFETI